MKGTASLTPDARALVENCPEAINALATRISDSWDYTVLFGTSRNLYASRLYRLRTLPIGSLAEFLESEFDGGVPVDFLTWLTEEVAACE